MCGYQTERKDTLKRHIYLKHQKPTKQTKPKNKRNKQPRQKTQAPQTPKKPRKPRIKKPPQVEKCDFCQYKCRDKFNLKRHLESCSEKKRAEVPTPKITNKFLGKFSKIISLSLSEPFSET